MKLEIPNKVILKAHHDWGDWYREAGYNLIFFDEWLKETWGIVIRIDHSYMHIKPKGFYPAEMLDKGKAALFMLKYYD